jgi:hypothetical protein
MYAQANKSNKENKRMVPGKLFRSNKGIISLSFNPFLSISSFVKPARIFPNPGNPHANSQKPI